LAVVVLDTDASRLQNGQFKRGSAWLPTSRSSLPRADFKDFRQYHGLRMPPDGDEP
jgi:hypothetical protein